MGLEINRADWFKSRVGKTVYRSKSDCACSVCMGVYRNGIKIMDVFHAKYIAEKEAIDNLQGDMVRFFDTKEEVRQYEESITCIF